MNSAFFHAIEQRGNPSNRERLQVEKQHDKGPHEQVPRAMVRATLFASSEKKSTRGKERSSAQAINMIADTPMDHRVRLRGKALTNWLIASPS